MKLLRKWSFVCGGCSPPYYQGGAEQVCVRWQGRMDDSLLGWAIDPSEITITKRKDGSDWVLGAGTYGKVYKGVRGGVQDVAVKMLHYADSEDGLKQFVSECCILKSLNYDRNIVQFYGACLLSGLTPMLVRSTPCRTASRDIPYSLLVPHNQWRFAVAAVDG